MSVEPPSVADLYPFESHYLNLGRLRMHYVDEGAGPAIVMVHGNPTWSFYYRELIKGLCDRYRVVAPDHIGCGLSDKPGRYDYTLAQHIQNLERLLAHLELDDVCLLLHDWGGAIGMGWAIDHPANVRRFMLCNTAAFFGPCPFRIRVCRWPLLGEIGVRGLNLFARAALRMACTHRARMTKAVKHGYLRPYDSYAHRVAILRFVRDIPLRRTHPSFATLARIESALETFRDHPLLICWGARDFCFNDWYLKQWKQRFPAAEVHRFDDAGHYVVEDAHERILPLVRAFLGGR